MIYIHSHILLFSTISSTIVQQFCRGQCSHARMIAQNSMFGSSLKCILLQTSKVEKTSKKHPFIALKQYVILLSVQSCHILSVLF